MATIPFHPGIGLGSVVREEALAVLSQQSTMASSISAQQARLNDAIRAVHSLKATQRELASLGILPGADSDGASQAGADLVDALLDSKKEVQDAAVALAKLRISSVKASVALRTQLDTILAPVSRSPEAPIDMVRSPIVRLPLSSDSMVFDCQYYSFGSNEQSARNALSQIASFVSVSTSFLGSTYSAEATASVEEQINRQRESHSLEGSLIITARCSHRDVMTFAPLVLDADGVVASWNQTFPDASLDSMDYQAMRDAAAEKAADSAKRLMLVTGAGLGSSFVGMVHIINNRATVSSQEMSSSAGSMQVEADMNLFIRKINAGAGVSVSSSSDLKNLLSNQSVQCHASMVTIGALPTITANEVALGVKTFANFDPASMMGKLSAMHNSNNTQKDTIASVAEAARTSSAMMQIRNSEVTSVMSSLAEIDSGKNKVVDVNSLMSALESYVEEARAGKCGVPISYRTRELTRSSVATTWLSTYFPQSINSIKTTTAPKEPIEGDPANPTPEAG